MKRRGPGGARALLTVIDGQSYREDGVETVLIVDRVDAALKFMDNGLLD